MLLRSISLLGFLVIGTGDVFAATEDVGQELWTYLHSHGYGVMPTDHNGQNEQMMSACVNGHWVTMMVDTGCGTTCLTHDCARHIGLEVRPLNDKDSGIGGQVLGVAGAALVSSLKLKGYEINRTNIVHVLSPDARLGEDGLFGFDFLRLNAVLLPVGANFFLFKPGPTPVMPVDSFLSRLGFHATQLTFGKGGLRTTARLNGHPFTAVVDCGSAVTLYDAMFVAKTAGLSLSGYSMYSEGPGLAPLSMYTEGIDGRRLQMYAFGARNLAFGETSFGSPDSVACYDSVLSSLEAQAFLGYDLLAEHEAIIDLGHDVLWMK